MKTASIKIKVFCKKNTKRNLLKKVKEEGVSFALTFEADALSVKNDLGNDLYWECVSSKQEKEDFIDVLAGGQFDWPSDLSLKEDDFKKGTDCLKEYKLSLQENGVPVLSE